MKRKISLLLFTIFVLLQFYPYQLPETVFDVKDDFISNNKVPDDIKNILVNSCYDCHSNQVNYPWYSYVAPIKFLVGRDVEHGRKELNFSHWEGLSDVKKIKNVEEIVESIEEGEMPYPIYLVTHLDAKLSTAQKQSLYDFFESYSESLFD